MAAETANGASETVTVIVPAHNEAASLPTLLPTLVEFVQERGWRLTVVNDGSTDDTAGIRSRAATTSMPRQEPIVTEPLVTTRRRPANDELRRGRALAARLGLPFVERGKTSIEALTRAHGVSAALVVSATRLRFVSDTGSLESHPSMATLRIAALRAGRPDRFVEAARLRPGDCLLDCTCGLGADAIVAAHAVGPTGRVLALEASRVLAAMVSDATRHYQHRDPALVRAMRAVRVTHADHVSFLRSQPDRSWDVVYFDPMFETTVKATRSLDLVRRLAARERPDRATIAEAGRVARRCVVAKDRAPGGWLDTVGLSVVSSSQRVWYGRLDVSSSRDVR